MSDKTGNFIGDFLHFQKFLLIGGIVWMIVTIGTIPFSDQIVDIIQRPLQGETLYFTSPTDSLFFLIKIHCITGLIVSSPILLMILWTYIAPALYQKERRFVLFLFISFVLLLAFAVVYGYFSLIPVSLHVLLGFTPEGAEILLTASEYSSFLISLFVILILVFQTPLIVFGLLVLNLVSPQLFRQKRTYIYFGVVILMAILTPTPDVITLAGVVVPVLIFFEIALFFGSLFAPKSSESEPEILDVIDSSEHLHIEVLVKDNLLNALVQELRSQGYSYEDIEKRLVTYFDSHEGMVSLFNLMGNHEKGLQFLERYEIKTPDMLRREVESHPDRSEAYFLLCQYLEYDYRIVEVRGLAQYFRE